MTADATDGIAPVIPSPNIKIEQDMNMSEPPMSLEKDEINPPLVPRLDDINAYHTVKHPSTVKAMPKQPANHGAPVREYMNKKVSGVLLEGMKLLSIEKPENPLRALGEYLLRRSAELEKPAEEEKSVEEEKPVDEDVEMKEG